MPPENFTEESLEDYPRGTMHVLLLSLERGDGNAHACATAVLCSAFDHLFRRYCYRTNETARLCARCWCWPPRFSGAASLDGPGKTVKTRCSLLFLFM